MISESSLHLVNAVGVRPEDPDGGASRGFVSNIPVIGRSG